MNLDKEKSISTYSVIPRIHPVGVETTISIRWLGEGLRYDFTRVKRLGHVRFDDDTDYIVTIYPMELYGNDCFGSVREAFVSKVRPKNNVITVS